MAFGTKEIAAAVARLRANQPLHPADAAKLDAWAAHPRVDDCVAADMLVDLAKSEQHFNTLQAQYRRLASTWLLAAFGGMGFTMWKVTGGDGIVESRLAIEVLGIAGSMGILVIWLLDQLVYFHLLNTSYRAAHEWEALYPTLPQVRHQRSDAHGLSVGQLTAVFYLLLTLAPIAAVWILTPPNLRNGDSLSTILACRSGFVVASFVPIAGAAAITLLYTVLFEPSHWPADQPWPTMQWFLWCIAWAASWIVFGLLAFGAWVAVSTTVHARDQTPAPCHATPTPTGTATPAASPTPEPLRQAACTTSALNLRACNSTDCRRLTLIARGDPVEVLRARKIGAKCAMAPSSGMWRSSICEFHAAQCTPDRPGPPARAFDGEARCLAVVRRGHTEERQDVATQAPRRGEASQTRGQASRGQVRQEEGRAAPRGEGGGRPSRRAPQGRRPAGGKQSAPSDLHRRREHQQRRRAVRGDRRAAHRPARAARWSSPRSATGAPIGQQTRPPPGVARRAVGAQRAGAGVQGLERSVDRRRRRLWLGQARSRATCSRSSRTTAPSMPSATRPPRAASSTGACCIAAARGAAVADDGVESRRASARAVGAAAAAARRRRRATVASHAPRHCGTRAAPTAHPAAAGATPAARAPRAAHVAPRRMPHDEPHAASRDQMASA